MSKSTPTLSDVAALAGVSTSAVSRTFTPGASASQETRRRVLAAAEQLSYRPNAVARTLSTRKSRMIAVVVSYLENQFYPSVIQALAQQLQAHGYHLLLFISDDHTSKDNDTDALLLDILQYQVDGIVLASTTLSSGLAARCHAAGIPVVLFNRTANVADVSTVTSDNYQGGKQAARLLLEGGARRISYIAGLEDSSTSQQREAGMLAELEAQGTILYQRASGEYQLESAAQATRKLFDTSSNDRPDAVFVGNDHMAFAVMDVLRNELGLRIPQDVQVVGFDDVPQASWGGYQLSTIAQDATAMILATVTTLLDQITSPPPTSPRHVVTPITVIKRATTH
ncbi:LacI family DNA-binding transcriptional regulator [Alcaligenaceae bacterium]|nr:LacI family DNA-binding transcriptional regulator [Alcaligenaceae bacterium]